MAKQLNVNLAFTADTSQARAQMQNLQQQLTSLINQPVNLGEKLTADIQQATAAAAELKIHLQNATNVKTGTLDFGKLNQSLKASGITLSAYATKLQSLGPAGQQAFMSLARSVAQAEIPLRRSNALLNELGTTLMNTARWQLSSSILHGFMGAVQKAYGYSQDLNESLNNIRIVTGYNIDQMSKFAAEANKAAKALSTTTTEYTNASLIYYQQGLSDAAVKARADITIKLANVSRQSAEVVSDQMTSIWNNFYNGSRSLEYYADVVTALGAATASSSEEIATGLEKFAAVAETVGLSYEYATAALATVTATTRQSADVVGTAFKTLFARIQDLNLGKTLDDGTTLGAYSQALMKVGINVKNANGGLKEMDDVLNEIGAKWKSLSSDQQVALAQSVAGVRQYTQLIALMDNWDFMKTNLETVQNSTGALKKQADIYAESWEAANKRVKASLETIYESVMDDEFFINITDGFASLIDGVGDFIKSIGGLQGVLAGLGVILTKVFNTQLAQGFSNLAYNIKMSTTAGAQAVQQAKAAEMRRFANTMVNYDTEGPNSPGATMKQVYSEELVMQEQLISNNEKLSETEQKKYQFLIDQHRVMGEQSIQLSRQLEKHQEIVATNKTELMGHGINAWGQESFNDISEAFNRYGKQAERMGEVDVHLKNMSSSAEITQTQIDELGGKLKGLISQSSIDEITADLTNAADRGKAMQGVVDRIGSEMQQTAIQAADMLSIFAGIEKGTPEYERLRQKIEQYLNSCRQAGGVQQQLNTSLDNGKKSADKFSEGILNAGKKTQTASQLFATATSGLMSLGMLISSVNGLIDTLKNPDVSGWEKFSMILTSVSMTMMSLTGVFTGLKAGYDLINSGILKNTAITGINTLAQSLNEKAQKKKSSAAIVNNALTASGNVLTNKSAQENTKEALANKAGANALREENAEKVKSIALDKIKGPTTTKSKTLSLKGGGKIPRKSNVKLDPGALKTIGSAAAKLVAAAAAIAIVATTIHLATESYNAHNIAAKEAAEQAKEAASAYDSVNQVYSDFISKTEAYDNAHKELANLTKGTEEYENAVLKANEATMALLNQYENLQYEINSEGLIILDETSLQQVKKLQQEQLKNAQLASLSASQNAKNKQLEADSINFQREKLKSTNSNDIGDVAYNSLIAGTAGAAAGALGIFALTNAWNPAGWAAMIVGGLAAIIGGVVTASVGKANEEESMALQALANEYSKNGNARFAGDSFAALLSDLNITDQKLIDSLTANRSATLELVKEMALNNAQRDQVATRQVFEQYEDIIKSYGLTSDQAEDISGMIGASIDDKIEALYEKTYKDKGTFGGGITDEEVQKQYAQAMGWAVDTIENQNGNKAKYYKKDGTEVGVISDEVARRYLAEKAVYKNLEQAVRNATKQFVKLTNSTKVYENAMADFLLASNFSTMTKVEFDALQTQIGGTDGIVDSSEAKTYIDDTFAYGDELTDEEAQAYGFSSAQAFYEAFLAGFKSYEEDRVEVLKNISKTAQAEMEKSGFNLNDLSNTSLKQIGSIIDTAIAQLGDNAGAFMSDIFAIAGAQAGELAVALDEIDWSNATPYSVIEFLESVGIAANYTEEELNNLIYVMQASFVQTIDDINAKLVILEKMSKLKQGDTIEAKQYSELSAEAQSYFTVMADGTYKLTQDAQDFYNVVHQEIKKVRLQGLAEDIQNSIQIKNSIQHDKNVLSRGTTNNYGITTYDQYIAGMFADTNIAGQVSIKDGKLVMPTMTKQDGNLWGKPSIKLTSVNASLAAKRNQDAGGIWGINVQTGATDNGNGTTTYSWGEATDFGTPFMFANSHSTIKKWGNKYDKTVYTSEADYLANAMKGIADQTAIDQAFKQVEYLKSTSFGLDTANAATIKAWEDAITAGTLTGEAAAKIAETTTTYLKEYEDLKAKDQAVLDHIGSLAFQHLSETESADELEEEYDNLLSMAENELQREKIKESYTGSSMAAIAEEKNEGLDPAQVDVYSDHLMEAAKASDLLDISMSKNTEEAKAIADEVARYTMKMNKGIEQLANNFEEWNSILTESNEASEEYHNAMVNIKDAMSDVLGVDEQFLTNSFIKDNLPLIEKAAEGSAEAIDELAEKAAQSILLDIGLNNGQFKEDLLKLESDMKSLIPDDIKIGATLNSEGFISGAQELINAAGMTVQEAQAYFNSLGYEPEFYTEEKDVEQRSPITVTETTVRGYTTGTAQMPQPDGSTIEQPWQWPILAQSTKTDGYTTSMGKMDVVALGANGKTPKIKSLTKKSSGAMNNASSVNKGGKPTSSGGGGSKKDKKNLNTDKKRYYEIEQSLKTIANKLDKVGAAKERAFGKAKADLIQQEIDLLDEEIEKTDDLLEEIAKYAETDMANLAAFGFTFDENNNITNYDEIMAQEIEAYNKAIASGDEGAIAAAEERWKLLQEYLSQFEETMDKWDEETLKAMQLKNQKYEKLFEKLTYSIEVKLDVDEDKLKLLDHALTMLEHQAFSTAEAIALMGDKTAAVLSQIKTYSEGITGLLSLHNIDEDTLAGLMDGSISLEELQDEYGFSDEDIAKLREYRDGLLAANEQLAELRNTVQEKVMESFQEWNEEMDRGIAKIEYLGGVLESYKNIVDLVGKSHLGLDDEFMKNMSKAQVANANDNLRANKAKYDAAVKARENAELELAKARERGDEESVKQWEKTLKRLDEEVQGAHQDMMSSWETALEAASSAFEEAVERTIATFEEAISGTFGSLEDLQAAFDQQTEITERYVDDYKKIYELSKLNRDIINSIDETDNVKAKRALRDLQEEINELQESNTQMSQYDLDHLRKKYELRLAEIALEEAQNAKTQVRMRKDSEGNYSYVFTADENEVEKARQNYEDKLYEMQELNTAYIREMQANILQSEIELANALRALDRSKFASDADYYAEVQRLTDYYTGQRNYNLDELNKGITNNRETYNEDWRSYSDLTGYKISADQQYLDSFNETVYAQLTGYQSIEDAQARFADATNIMIESLKQAYVDWQAAVKLIMETAGTSVEDFAKDAGDAIGKISEESSEAAGDVEEMAKDFEEAFKKVVESVTQWQVDYSEAITAAIAANTAMATSCTSLIEMLSGLNGGLDVTTQKFAATATQIEDAAKRIQDAMSNASSNAGSGGGGSGGGGGGGTDYDNQGYTEAQVKAAQAYVGATQDGKWGADSKAKAIAKCGSDRIADVFAHKAKHKTGNSGGGGGGGGGRDIVRVIFDDGRPLHFDTGGYTGSWGSSGRMAMLHQKELVLNAQDTENMLKTVDMVRNIVRVIDLNAGSHSGGLGYIGAAYSGHNAQVIEQEVTIHAEFPNAVNHTEIEMAFDNLINHASQFANRIKK